MAFYRQLGNIPPKRHTQHRDEEGRLYFEELMGEEGFSSDSSLLYHRHIPSAIVDATVWELRDQTTTPNHPLKPRHLKLHDLFPEEIWAETDVVTGRRLILGNADVRLSYVVSAKESPLYRNSLGDEMVYVESGEAIVETVFGALHARPGDYVLIPMSTTHRWVPQDRNRCARTQSRRTVTSFRPSVTCRSSGSSSSTRRSASATCTAPPSR